MALPYPIATVPQYLVDHQGLQNLYNFCSKNGARVALIGFNETAKHLVNLCGDHIVGFYDAAAWKVGITFRGKPVAGAREKLDITHIAVCDPLLAYDFGAAISELYGDRVPVYCPPRLDQKQTERIDPFTQEQIYKDIFSQASEAPASMLERDKTGLVMELLRYSLRLPGDVLEMGVWQGGTAWHLAKVLSWMGETRHLYLVDLFEKLVNNRNATMCDEEIRRTLGFYPNVTMISGLVQDTKVLAQLATCQFCFAHYDLGLNNNSLEHVWDRLSPGAPLILDNYGLLAAWPGRFERFFVARDTRIIRLPWSGQGLVFKHFA